MGPACSAVTSLDHTKFINGLPPLSDNNLEKELKESTTKEIKCPYCDWTFENMAFILALHVKQSHQKKKKEFFHKIKRKNKLMANKSIRVVKVLNLQVKN